MSIQQGDLRIHPDDQFAIVVARWNPRITDALREGAEQCFAEHGATAQQIRVVRVPGAWEVAQYAAMLAKQGRVKGIVALGCVVRGDTRHYEHIADGSAQALMQASLDHGTPIAHGILAVETMQDAEARAGGSLGNKGEECALAIIEMADLLRKESP